MATYGKQLSDGNSSGTGIGQDASDIVGFHGKTACAQATYPGTLTGTSTSANAYAMIIALRDVLINKGFVAAS